MTRSPFGQKRAALPEVTDKLLLKSMEITPTTANLTAYTSAAKEASLGRKLAALGNELLSSEQAPAEALSHAQTVIQGLAESGGAGEAATVVDALNALCDRVERQSEDGETPVFPLALLGWTSCWAEGTSTAGYTSSVHGPPLVNPHSPCRSP